ncbi:MAG: ABC transporter ATP-binding protein, partial [Planctomycetota bacterium]
MTAAPEPSILRVDDLCMSFGAKEVLKSVSFEVRRGEIFGFIGPNGAGKTTTIRILATLLLPKRGDLWIDGFHVIEMPAEVRRRIGYMPDYVGVYPGLTVREYLQFFAGAYRLRGKRREAILSDVIELTDLGKLIDTEVQHLSKGMRQRLCLAQTLIHDPEMLILDEPASGLDPRARIEFRALLKELRRMGKTIFLSSHILTELSPICDSVGIIEQGVLVAWGGVEEILAKLRGDAVAYEVVLHEVP